MKVLGYILLWLVIVACYTGFGFRKGKGRVPSLLRAVAAAKPGDISGKRLALFEGE
jgi:hypothetical protein